MNEAGKRTTVFLIEEDDQTRVPLVRTLRSDGYRVVIAVDEESALDLVGSGDLKMDIVLVNLVGQSAAECLSIGRKVRTHAQSDGNSRVVVMPEKYGKDVEGTDVADGDDWIMYQGEDPEQLKNLLGRLTAEL